MSEDEGASAMLVEAVEQGGGDGQHVVVIVDHRQPAADDVESAWRPFPGADQVAAALAIGAVGYGASITLWVAGARDLGAARGQLVFATAPFFGSVVAWTVLGEQVAIGVVAVDSLVV